MCVCVIALAGSLAPSAGGQALPAEGFAFAFKPGADTAVGKYESRARRLVVDQKTLQGWLESGLAPGAAGKSQVSVELFDGKTVSAPLRRVDVNRIDGTGAVAVNWIGAASGADPAANSWFSVTVSRELDGRYEFTSLINTSISTIRIVRERDDVYRMFEIDKLALPPMKDSHPVADPAPLTTGGGRVTSEASRGATEGRRLVSVAGVSEVDLMIRTTTGYAFSWADASGLVGQVNAIYQFSSMPIHLNLVGGLTSAVAASGSMDTDLTNLRFNPTVRADRDRYLADLVMLVRPNATGSTCGIANVITPPSGPLANFEDLAYSVVARSDPDCSPFSAAHELGHNFSSLHDRAQNNVESNPPFVPYFPYGFGYTDGAGHKDIMAYPDFCGSQCTETGLYSSPNFLFSGTSIPMGNADNDARRAIIDAAPTVAQYRRWPEAVSTAVTPLGTTSVTQHLVKVEQAFVYHRACSGACDSPGGWTAPGLAPTGLWPVSNVASVGLRNGDVHFAFLMNGYIYHQVRYANGSWSGSPAQASYTWTGSGVTDIAISAGPDPTNPAQDAEQFAFVQNGIVKHAMRYSNGSWSSTGAPLPNQLPGVTGVAAGQSGPDTQFAFIKNGNMYHQIRYANGSWSGDANGQIKANLVSFAGGLIDDVAAAGSLNGDVQFGLAQNGEFHHLMRFVNSSWSALGYPPNTATGFVRIIAASGWPNPIGYSPGGAQFVYRASVTAQRQRRDGSGTFTAAYPL